MPPGVNEQLIKNVGFHLVQQEDVTENAASVSGRWHQARQRYQDALLQIEGEERFEGLQQFLASVHRLTTERRLSRVVYLVERALAPQAPDGWEPCRKKEMILILGIYSIIRMVYTHPLAGNANRLSC